MAKIARRSVASNPSSLTSITIPPTNFIEDNFNLTTNQYKRSTNSKNEINVPNSISATTPLTYSSTLSSLESASSSSESFEVEEETTVTLTTSSTSDLQFSEVETTETAQLLVLSKATTTQTSSTEVTSTETTISTSIDPLRSTDYQLTTRTIQQNYQNISSNNTNENSHNNNDGSATKLHEKSNKNHNFRNNGNSISNASKIEATKKVPITSTQSSFISSTEFSKTNIPLLSSIDENTAMTPEMLAAQRAKIRMEFYATYDVMTGVRIAATLGGFFSLMVFLIVWKSRSHSDETIKALKDPKTAALTVACMQEEEDRKIIEAMDATGMSIFPDEYDTMIFRRQRMLSVGNVSAPPILHRGFRFSSVGGYSSLLEPPRRFSISSTGGGRSNARRKSASETSRILSNYPMGSSFGTDDYFIETDDELDETYDNLNQTEQRLLQNQGFLVVPSSVHHDTRRSSAMTCCSTESSYLERRNSALTLGINNLPPALRQKEEPTIKTRRGSSTETWDYYYPDIQVIQATPKTSPLASEKIFDKGNQFKQGRTVSQDTTTTAGSGFSSTTLDSSGSSWQKNSMACFYDPESLQDRRLPSIDSEHSLDFSHSNTTDESFENQSRRAAKHPIRQPTIITTTSATPSPKTLTDKFDENMQELKLRKYSDASSCLNNNTSFSYYVSNTNNNIFDSTGSCITPGITQPPSSTYSVSRGFRSNLRGVGTIGGTGIGRAPLASCSSFKMSSVECPDSEMRSSFGDDESVFIESYADTDDDLEQFSTDSDEISLEIDQSYLNETIDFIDDNGIKPTLPINKDLKNTISENYDRNSFYEHQISTKSAPPDILNGKHYEEIRSEGIDRGAILKQSQQQASIDSHRTHSVSSSDKILLVSKSKHSAIREQGIGKKIKLKSSENYNINAQCNNKIYPSTLIEQKQEKQQEELLLKPILSPANTPLLAIKRSHFQQQFSDASHSLPTTDETTTTLETCSTEVPVVVTTIVTTNLTGTSTTTSVFSPATSHNLIDAQIPLTMKKYQQNIFQKPSTTIKKQSSFSYDNNNDSSISSSSNSNNININKNINKKRISSCKDTIKKFKVKTRTAFSDSSDPPTPQSAQSIAALKQLSNRTKILMPQLSDSSSQIDQTQNKTNQIMDNITVNYDKENGKICEKTYFQKSNGSLHPTKNIKHKKNRDRLDGSNNIKIENSNNLHKSISSNNQFIQTNIDNSHDDNNKKKIVDVSIVIEGVEFNDNSTDLSNINKTNDIVIDNNEILSVDNSKTMTSTSVMLELPVMNIPTEIEDDDSNSSISGIDTNEFSNLDIKVRSKSERCDPPIRDPSLPGSSRKWSKETLF